MASCENGNEVVVTSNGCDKPLLTLFASCGGFCKQDLSGVHFVMKVLGSSRQHAENHLPAPKKTFSNKAKKIATATILK